ncbi:glycosyltransferase family 2 protein [Thermodesulfobacteriota bacterium]
MNQVSKGELTPVSVVVFTMNEELNVETALQSVFGWCGEIIVVDSGSSDRSIDICRRYTDRIFSHPYTDHSSQWEWTLGNVDFSFDWILRLDADHVCSEELKANINNVLTGGDQDIKGYYVVHKHYFLNSPVRGLNTFWLSLVNRNNVRIDKSELVDFRFVVNGKTGILKSPIIENNRKEMDIDFWIDKHQKFAARMAVEETLRRRGMLKWSSDMSPSLFGTPDQRILWLKNRWYRLPLYLRPFIFFFYRYFVRLGFVDGSIGFVYHFLQAFWFRMLVDIRITQLEARILNGELDPKELENKFVNLR